MRKDAISSNFAMMVGTTITHFILLLLLVCLPVANADKSTVQFPSDYQTSQYVRSLDQEQRRLLQKSVRRSLNRFSSKGNTDQWAAVPGYQIYHSVFLEILMKPLLAASLPEQDLKLIRALPSHNDRQFAEVALDVMAGVCRIVERSNVASTAAVNLAANRINQAQMQVERVLDRHYRAAVGQLTDTGKALVESEYDKLIEQDSLVYTQLDLEMLGFTQPDFVFAFLQDSCANAERILPELVTDQRTLQDQLEDDFQQGAVQLFQHQ